MNKDNYEIYDEGFNGCKRLLKNGKSINEFGMLKELEKANERIKDLESTLSELVFEADQISNIGFFSGSGNWTPKSDVIDALEARVKVSKLLIGKG